jgi:hypothetical protein
MAKKTAKIVANGRKLSEILSDLEQHFHKPKITLGELRDILSGRSYGILLFLFALPNVLPIPAPGISALSGALLILVAAQMMFGKKHPWFPEFLKRRSISGKKLERVCKRVIPHIKRIEYATQPRLQFLIKPPADRLIALICIGLSLIVMLPIPLGNAAPGLAIALFAMAILMHDGILVLFGLIVAALSFLVVSAAWKGAMLSLQALLGA